jgi:hypothetical protein
VLFLSASYFIPGNVAIQVPWRYSHFGGNVFINHACPNQIKYFVMQFPPRVYSTHFKWLILWIFFKLPELVVISFIVLLNGLYSRTLLNRRGGLLPLPALALCSPPGCSAPQKCTLTSPETGRKLLLHVYVI